MLFRIKQVLNLVFLILYGLGNPARSRELGLRDPYGFLPT